MTIDNLIIFASNYKCISKVLPKRFCFSRKYASFLKMYYLNYYYKAVLKSDDLTAEQYDKLKEIRPPSNYIVCNLRGLVYFILNLFPVKFVRLFFSLIKK